MKIEIDTTPIYDPHLKNVEIKYKKILQKEEIEYKKIKKILVVWDIVKNESEGIPLNNISDREVDGAFVLPTSTIKKPQLINVSMIKIFYENLEEPEIHLFSVSFTSANNTILKIIPQ